MAGFFATILEALGLRSADNTSLPKYPRTPPPGDLQYVKSHSDPSVFYSVDTANVTCSCPDWGKRRSEFQSGDIRRLCKHLAQVVIASNDKRFFNFWGILNGFASRGWGIPIGRTPELLVDDGVTIGVLNPEDGIENPWFSISYNGIGYAYSRRFDKWEGRRELPDKAREIFFRHVFGCSKIETQIVTDRRSTEKKDIPKSIQGSWGVSESIFTNGGWVAFGSIEDVPVRAFINPRAAWQCFLIEKFAVPYDVKNDDWRGPNNLSHIKQAATTWLISEYEECRAAKKKR